MSDDLDDRIAYLKQQRQSEGAAHTQKAADLIEAIDELQGLVRETAFKSATVEAKMKLVITQMDELESRVKRTRFFLVGGIAVTVAIGALIFLTALWAGNNLRSAAQAEADSLRIVYAEQIEAARLEGDAQLALLRAEIDRRRADVERQIVEVGAELSEIIDERDVTRVALEELVELRNRIGVEFVEYRGRVIFVVPDGRQLVSWRAPGLSNVGSYNGRMYRLSQ
jgi:hypothetical protein